ncbi:uncharacterized protein LOC106940900 [Poecilia latipinna]|uniref:uncharacterized protein LOC106940900 n=1 Tax=Poecilia latipinna TaxID=48699 RepID=UPI00072E3B11|nr:PREDICTED: uncharacterized protein LOC106940900 [Poecilia latipinna]
MPCSLPGGQGLDLHALFSSWRSGAGAPCPVFFLEVTGWISMPCSIPGGQGLDLHALFSSWRSGPGSPCPVLFLEVRAWSYPNLPSPSPEDSRSEEELPWRGRGGLLSPEPGEEDCGAVALSNLLLMSASCSAVSWNVVPTCVATALRKSVMVGRPGSPISVQAHWENRVSLAIRFWLLLNSRNLHGGFSVLRIDSQRTNQVNSAWVRNSWAAPKALLVLRFLN